jgi:hypothetical protein
VAVAAPLVAAARHSPWWLVDLPACVFAAVITANQPVALPTIPRKQRTSLS